MHPARWSHPNRQPVIPRWGGERRSRHSQRAWVPADGRLVGLCRRLRPKHRRASRQSRLRADVAGATANSAVFLDPSGRRWRMTRVTGIAVLVGVMAGLVYMVPKMWAVPTLDGVEPVSYTHLRAHETRHDLVCRLLL